MAHTFARITGVALKPGISRNAREYTREAIASAVARGQKRIDDGDEPMNIYTSHGAADADDSTRIIGRLTKLSLAPDGSATYEAELADTPHARTIANLIDTSGGNPYVRGVSIRGAWLGSPKRRMVEGRQVEYADDLELRGLDITASPGVPGAKVDSISFPGRTRETEDGRPLIFESVEDAVFTEAAADHAAPGCDGKCCDNCGVNATQEAATGAGLAEKGAPALKSGKPAAPPTPGASDYADPGYQDDKAKRYPLDTKAHAKAAYSYLSMRKNASKYTPAQLKRIKARIVKALIKFGVKVDTKEGWLITPAELVTEAAVAEADIWPDRPGCYQVTIDNGTVCISVSSMSVDPADLEVAARCAMEGACAALAQIDPDMDGDIDQPGPDDDDGPKPTTASSHPDDDAMESAPEGASQPPVATAGDANQEGAGMSDPTNVQADPAPQAAAPIDAPQAQEVPAVEHVDEPKLSLGQVKDLFASFAQAMHREPAMAGAPAESASVEGEVTETAETPAEPVAETQEQLVQRLVAEGVRSALQDHAENGGVQRKGLVTEQAVPGAAPVSDEFPESWPRENGVPVPAHKMTAEQWKAVTRDTLPGSIMHSRG